MCWGIFSLFILGSDGFRARLSSSANFDSISCQHPSRRCRSEKLVPSRKQTRLEMAIKGPVRYTTQDWLENITSWPHSLILHRIKVNLIVFTLWTAFLTWFYKSRAIKFLFPATIHSIAGSTLSLLLVFRTNSSYDRFWEGRKCWGSIICLSRDLARLISQHIDSKYHSTLGQQIMAFSVCLKQHLQGEKSNVELLPFYNSEDEVKKVQAFKNRPIYVLKQLGEQIRAALKDNHHDGSANAVVQTMHEHQFEHYFHGLSNAMASCERIVKQPVPLSYSRHTSRFLTLYLLSLPLTLIPLIGWMSVPTMLAICWSFLSVQEIGHFIEDPFDKETQVIPFSLILSVMRTDISEILNGVLSGKKYQDFDDMTLSIAKAKSRSRFKSENWFVYY